MRIRIADSGGGHKSGCAIVLLFFASNSAISDSIDVPFRAASRLLGHAQRESCEAEGARSCNS